MTLPPGEPSAPTAPRRALELGPPPHAKAVPASPANSPNDRAYGQRGARHSTTAGWLHAGTCSARGAEPRPDATRPPRRAPARRCCPKRRVRAASTRQPGGRFRQRQGGPSGRATQRTGARARGTTRRRPPAAWNIVRVVDGRLHDGRARLDAVGYVEPRGRQFRNAPSFGTRPRVSLEKITNPAGPENWSRP